MTDRYESFYALGIDEGMSPEEAHEWATSQSAPRARARRAPGGSGGMEGKDTPEPSNPPDPPGGSKGGLGQMIERAEARKEPTFVVDGLLPTGLTVMAGASKLGKSFGVLDICFGVANGSPVLGSMVCEQGDVLYLALEDTSTRLRARLDSLEPDRGAWPWDALTIVSMDMVEGQALGVLITEWAEAADKPVLVAIDTITRFGGLGERSGYAAEVQWMSKFHAFASKFDLALLGVTHTNQMKMEEGDDWFNKISGTTGIIGTADNVMLLDAKRGENEGVLRIEGRDMEPTEYALRKVGPWWQQTSQLRGGRGDLSVAIADFVILRGEATTADVAAEFSISSDKASQYLGRIRKNGIISTVKRGVWSSART